MYRRITNHGQRVKLLDHRVVKGRQIILLLRKTRAPHIQMNREHVVAIHAGIHAA